MLRPRASQHAVVVFALDEGARVIDQVSRMGAVTSDVDLIIADGGSADGSMEAIACLSLPSLRAILINRGPRGLGVQMRMAFDYAISDGYEGVVVLDGNGKDDVSAIPLFVNALVNGLDHVQGSRFVHGGAAINTPLDRLLALRLIHAPLIRFASGFPYTDTTNGFRAYSTRLLSDERVAVFRDVFVGYELHYYLAIRAARLQFRVCEVPVTRAYPAGAVPTKIRGLGAKRRLLMALVKAVVGGYNPRPAP